jgi:hypothetical protein
MLCPACGVTCVDGDRRVKIGARCLVRWREVAGFESPPPWIEKVGDGCQSTISPSSRLSLIVEVSLLAHCRLGRLLRCTDQSISVYVQVPAGIEHFPVLDTLTVHSSDFIIAR